MTATSNDFVRTFAVTGPLDVSIELGSGEIEISADAVTETTVRLQPDPAGDPEALDLIARARVDLRGNALRIDVPRAMGFRRHPDVIVIAQVPAESTVGVRAASADARLRGTFGDVDVTSGSGDVRVDTAGNVKAGTGSGDVLLDLVNSAAVKTGSGDIAIERCRNAARLTSASGDIRVTELGGGQISSASGDVELGSADGNVDVQTASGDVNLGRVSVGEVQVKTATGDVGIGVTAGTATLLDCSSITGQVSSELEPSGEPADADERRLVVRARTVSGSIAIRRA